MEFDLIHFALFVEESALDNFFYKNSSTIQSFSFHFT